MNEIVIVSSSDSRYVQHLGVTMVSILENTSSRERIRFCIIDGGMSDSDKKLLRSCIVKYGCRIEFPVIKPEYYKKLKAQSYQGLATYFRIFVSELFDESVKKIIYLDCDIVVRGDIAELWDVDVSQHVFAAVEDAGLDSAGEFGSHYKKSMGMPQKARYLNAGVLLINLEKWRSENIPGKIMDFLLEHGDKIMFADQDGINGVLYNRWLVLPSKWNQQAYVFERLRQKQVLSDDLTEAVLKPSIVHYSLKSKPWHYMNTHPLKKEYYIYLFLTPWKGFVPADRTLLNRLIKALIRIPGGRFIYNYFDSVKWAFENDRKAIDEKISKRFIFKLLYYILFPLGRIYMKIFLKVARLTYFLEYQKVLPLIFNGGIFAKILYLLTLPARYMVPASARDYFKNEFEGTDHTCPCCGYKSLKGKSEKTELCKICYWENSRLRFVNPELDEEINGLPLHKAQKNFLKYGASEERFRYVVKPKLFFFQKDKAWKPFKKNKVNRIQGELKLSGNIKKGSGTFG